MPKEFYGWYDLGGVEPAPLFAIRQARYKTRFMLCRFPVAMYDALIALIPKPEAPLTDRQTKALLAYLNSSLTQYYIETRGRYIAKGPIGLEVNMVREMPILDVRKLPNELVTELASLFDRLEAEARRIGGASRKEDLEKLKPIIQGVDRAFAKLLHMPEDVVKSVEDQVDMLVERRIAGSKEERRESVRGEAEVKLKPPRRRRITEAPPKAPPLDRFMAS
jgi:hypothetical protein